MKRNLHNIILSRTDSIGDMILALPMAKVLKDKFPDITIAILGRPYTKPVVDVCNYVDEFIELDAFLQNPVTVAGDAPQAILHVKPESYVAKRAKQLKIPLRIGTTNRLYHWFTCNKLVRLSRKKSNLHEAQLNLKLLKPFGIDKVFSYEEIAALYGFNNIQPLQPQYAALIDKNKYNLILHPKSRGSAREWGLDNFISLIKGLDTKKYNIFISGTEGERTEMQPLFDAAGDTVTDIAGKISLDQFISFINQCDGLVACSTGPLHIAAAAGRDAYGLYAPIRPIHAGRWGPIGKKAEVFVLDKECNVCAGNKQACHCIKEILPATLLQAISKNETQSLNLKLG